MRQSLILAAALLAACGDAAREDTIGKEIADDYNEALDKAEAVEGQLDAANGRVDDALDDADGVDDGRDE